MADNQESTTSNRGEDKVVREYECAYILAPTIPAEKVPAAVADIKKTLTQHGAKLANEQEPERIPLAYEMAVAREGKRERYLEGYFGWITMEAESEAVNRMKEELAQNYQLIRFMLIRALKDQQPRSTDSEAEAETEAETEAEPAAEDGPLVSPQSEDDQKKREPADTAEIDRSIEELVAEEPSSEAAK